MISFTVMATIMARITQIPQLDVLTIGNSNTPMAHAYQAAPTHIEMNGITDHISVILLALVDILMLRKKTV